MKRIFVFATALLFSVAVSAQTPESKPTIKPAANSGQVKSTSPTKQTPTKQVAPTKETKTQKSSPTIAPSNKVAPTTTKDKVKKDGTPDKRYKENKNLKKDGTPDKRYKENKSDEKRKAATPAPVRSNVPANKK
jgi:hypothetical protein